MRHLFLHVFDFYVKSRITLEPLSLASSIIAAAAAGSLQSTRDVVGREGGREGLVAIYKQ